MRDVTTLLLDAHPSGSRRRDRRARPRKSSAPRLRARARRAASSSIRPSSWRARRFFTATQWSGLWGEVSPVPACALTVLKGGERIEAGGRRFEVAYTPGHASHHVSYFNAETGIAFVGDTAGIKIVENGYVLPPTPPPDINLEAWDESLRTIEGWRPETLFLTHFGPYGGASALIAELRDHLALAADLVKTSLVARRARRTARAMVCRRTAPRAAPEARRRRGPFVRDRWPPRSELARTGEVLAEKESVVESDLCGRCLDFRDVCRPAFRIDQQAQGEALASAVGGRRRHAVHGREDSAGSQRGGQGSESRTSRSSWNCTSRYSGIETAPWHSTNTPNSLTFLVITLANRVVPRWSFHVRRAGRLTERRSAVRLFDAEFVGVTTGPGLGHWKLQGMPDERIKLGADDLAEAGRLCR